MRFALTCCVFLAVSTAHAEPLLFAAGAGASTRGATVSAGAELHAGSLAWAVRGDLANRRLDLRIGWRPRLGDEGHVDHVVLPVAGARQERGRSSVLAGIRISPSDDLIGDHIEVGLAAIVAGRDQLFVQHARYMPGWFARGQLRISHVVVGIDVGMTGLEMRDAMGGVRPDAHALATLGLAVQP